MHRSKKMQRYIIRVALESMIIITLMIRRESGGRKPERTQREIWWKLLQNYSQRQIITILLLYCQSFPSDSFE